MERKIIEKTIAKKLNYYSWEQFESDARTYIAAIREGRMMCSIPSVSKSGMSRVIAFYSCELATNGYFYRNYRTFFTALGYTESRSEKGFTIGGCGMNMVFHTNYSIMGNLCSLGLITKDECDRLSQQTPTVL